MKDKYKKILFVLGAGASKPFGFPLGNELILRIIDGIKQGEYKVIYECFDSWNDEKPTYYDFLSNPYKAFYSAICCDRARVVVKQYDEEFRVSLRKPDYHNHFADLLDEKTGSSIDDVLNDNPEYSFIGRVYIALEILRSYIESSNRASLKDAIDNNSFIITPDYERFKKTSPVYPENWYSALAGFIKRIARNRNDLDSLCDHNIIRFITFNYDMSLEYYLRKFFKDQIHGDFNIERIISNIFHVYGKVDLFDYRNSAGLDINFLELILGSAKRISLVRGNGVNKDENIKIHLSSGEAGADVICILGFAFDEVNRGVIGLDDALRSPAKKAYILNYGNDKRISDAIGDLNMQNNIMVDKGASIKKTFESNFISSRIILRH